MSAEAAARQQPQRKSKALLLWPALLGLLLGTVLGTAGLLLSGGSGWRFAQSIFPAPQVLAAAVTQPPGDAAATPSATASPAWLALPEGATATRTPFQPVTNTPTITPSPTPSATPTATATATATATSTPKPRPTDPPGPPESASVSGLVGYAQSLPLSCESRSAVDWARFFGVSIGELEFQGALPLSDNPNKGFVGNVRGPFGLTPPNGYGVHAPAVARLLRAYGLRAEERSGMSLRELQEEIASGEPVMVWVIGSVMPGYSIAYTASDGETLTVAPYEHTVIVTGYSPSGITVTDGALVYAVSVERFLQSWSVLGNMAVIAP